MASRAVRAGRFRVIVEYALDKYIELSIKLAASGAYKLQRCEDLAPDLLEMVEREAAAIRSVSTHFSPARSLSPRSRDRSRCDSPSVPSRPSSARSLTLLSS